MRNGFTGRVVALASICLMPVVVDADVGSIAVGAVST